MSRLEELIEKLCPEGVEYKKIVDVTYPIFDDDDTTPPIDTERVKVVMFVDQQAFEFHTDNSKCAVESQF